MSWFQSTHTTETRCPRCRAALLTAIDEGMPATVNAEPLADRAAEVAALLDGRRTYVHTERRLLVYRNATRIRGNTIPGTIHAEHKCTGPQQLLLDDFLEHQ